jgi:hypothetical protein
MRNFVNHYFNKFLILTPRETPAEKDRTAGSVVLRDADAHPPIVGVHECKLLGSAGPKKRIPASTARRRKTYEFLRTLSAATSEWFTLFPGTLLRSTWSHQ